MADPGQTITSIVAGATAALRRLLTVAAGDANTPDPLGPPIEDGYRANGDGILHLYLRDDDPIANPWTTAVFVVWVREEGLSDEWHEGAQFTWDVDPVAGDGYVIDINIHGATLVWVEMISKATAAGAASIWAGTNTVPGA